MGLRAGLINGVLGSHLVPGRLRLLLLRAFGMQVPVRGAVSPGVIFRTTALTMGARSSINYGCIFDNRARVTIGRRVGVGIGVRFITSSHDMDDPDCRAGEGSLRPIVVGDGTWIGSAVTLLGGVTIGPGCVIAAGAVVTKDCQPHGLYAGVPARRLRDLSP